MTRRGHRSRKHRARSRGKGLTPTFERIGGITGVAGTLFDVFLGPEVNGKIDIVVRREGQTPIVRPVEVAFLNEMRTSFDANGKCTLLYFAEAMEDWAHSHEHGIMFSRSYTSDLLGWPNEGPGTSILERLARATMDSPVPVRWGGSFATPNARTKIVGYVCTTGKEERTFSARSIKEQATILTVFARDHGYHLSAMYRDMGLPLSDGCTRTGLVKLLDSVDDDWEAVVVVGIDRLETRDPSLNAVRELKEGGKRCLVVGEPAATRCLARAKNYSPMTQWFM